MHSSDFRSLSLAIIEQLNMGVLPTNLYKSGADVRTLSESLNIMPRDWVRGAMLIRSNSLIRGHSGVRWRLIESMVDMLNKNISPVGVLSVVSGCYSNEMCRLSQSEGASVPPAVSSWSIRLCADSLTIDRFAAAILCRGCYDWKIKHPCGVPNSIFVES
jgi:hypothetical protein